MKYLLILFFAFTLNAHQLKENYLQVHYSQKTQIFTFVLEVESRLLENEIILDDNKNGIISFKELNMHKSYLFDYTKQHFKLFHKSKPLTLDDAKILFHRYQDQTYMRITKSYSNLSLDDIKLEYDMFFELEDIHKLLIHLDNERGDYILNNRLQTYNFSSFKMTLIERLNIFISSGISHILDGLDHLLFVLMILIPSIVFLQSHKASKEIQTTLIDIFKIITTFSIAHSLTLFVSGMGLWIPSIAFVESSIALSIFVVALMNFLQKYEHVNKKIVFLFGLLHGFGFANVLEIAKVDNSFDFLIALFGFNLGVEIGQFFVVFALLPFLYFLAKTSLCAMVLRTISFLAMGVSLFWFLQRVGLT